MTGAAQLQGASRRLSTRSPTMVAFARWRRLIALARCFVMHCSRHATLLSVRLTWCSPRLPKRLWDLLGVDGRMAARLDRAVAKHNVYGSRRHYYSKHVSNTSSRGVQGNNDEAAVANADTVHCPVVAGCAGALRNMLREPNLQASYEKIVTVPKRPAARSPASVAICDISCRVWHPCTGA